MTISSLQTYETVLFEFCYSCELFKELHRKNSTCIQLPIDVQSSKLQLHPFLLLGFEYWFMYSTIKRRTAGGPGRTQLTHTSGQRRGENELRRGWINMPLRMLPCFTALSLCRAQKELWASLVVNPLRNERANTFSLTGKHTHTHLGM